MKYNRCFIIFLLLILNNKVIGQEIDIKKDIDDLFLNNLIVENDTTKLSKFQNFAIRLFLEGDTIESTILKNNKHNFVGVGIINNSDKINERKLEFNLYALSYRDNRERDFHKRIYFPGFEGIANFKIICYNEEQKKILNDAIESYLDENIIPKKKSRVSIF